MPKIHIKNEDGKYYCGHINKTAMKEWHFLDKEHYFGAKEQGSWIAGNVCKKCLKKINPL